MSQPLIKLLLLSGIFTFGILAMRSRQTAGHRAFWRLSGLVVVVLAALSVLFPNALTAVAHIVGVDRGTDLLLYILVVAFMLVVVILFRRLAELEQRYVQLVRTVALDQAYTSKADHNVVQAQSLSTLGTEPDTH